MSIEQEIIRHKKYIEIIASGEFDLRDAINNIPTVMHSCRLSGLSKVLIDYRKLNGDIFAVEKIIYAQESIDQYKNHLASGGKKLQFAYAGKIPQVSTYKPGLEAAASEGIKEVFVTDDIDEAYKWLGVKKS